MYTKNSEALLNEVDFKISLDQSKCGQVDSNTSVLRTAQWHVGFNNLRKQSAHDAKLGFKKGTIIFEPDIQEVTELANKEKWMQCFKKAYRGEVKRLPHKAYDPEISRMFIAKFSNKEIGFIRITNYTKQFKEVFDGEIWNIAEIYVKPLYRNQGVSTRLINHVLRFNHVKSILLDPESYNEHHYYFNRQGFTYSLETQNGLLRVYVDHFKDIALRRMAYASSNETSNI